MINYGCAHIPAPAVLEQPSSMYVDRGFLPIDPEHPPTEGVWSTWEDARAYANNVRLERIQVGRQNIALSSENEILSKTVELQKKEYEKSQSGYRAWLAYWGLPVGLLCGFALGMGLMMGVNK